MRALFLLLVAANLAFFAWMRYYAANDATTDSQPLGRQITPDKIRIIPGSDPVKAPAARPAGATAGACIEWGGFATAEAPKAEQALAPLALGARLTQQRTQEKAGWWVYIPPQGDRPGAQRKTAELKSLGVEDYFIVQDEGPMRWAISLGVFSTEDAAKSYLESLRNRKVRSAQSGERETQVAKTWFRVRAPDAALQAKLRELAAAYPGTEVRDCP